MKSLPPFMLARIVERPGSRSGPPSGERGHTLIEMMVASVVFIISMLGVFALQTTVAGNNILAADWSLASNLAASGLERLRVDDFNDVVGVSSCPPTSPRDLPCYFDRRGVPLPSSNGAYFTRTWQATTDPVAQVTDILVKVTWKFSISGYVVNAANVLQAGQETREVEITGRIYPR